MEVFMKGIVTKLTATALVASFAATGAYASKTQLWTQGQGERGSRTVSSDRNFLLNPTSLLKRSNWVNLELVAPKIDSVDTQTNAQTTLYGDQVAAEGGASYRIADNLAAVVYLEKNTSNAATLDSGLRGINAAASYLGVMQGVSNENRTHVGVASTVMGINVGLNYWMQNDSSTNAANQEFKQETSGLVLGLSGEGWSFELNQGLGTKWEGIFVASATYEGKSGMTLGGSFDVMGMTLEGYYGFGTAEAVVSATANTYEIKGSGMGLKVSKSLGGGASVQLGYVTGEQKTTGTAGSDNGVSKQDKKESHIPLTVHFNSKVSDSVTLLGSVSRTLMSDWKDAKGTGEADDDSRKTDNTSVRMGASVASGKLVTDIGLGHTIYEGSVAGAVAGITDVRASLTYNF